MVTKGEGRRARAVLTLVRHGETRENAAGRWQGRSDSPLTEEGKRQAEQLAGRLRLRGPFAAIYASPLGRALETARLVAPVLGDLAVRPAPGLVEYDFGEWDGLTPAELRARGFWDRVARDPGFAPPGGEPFSEAARRVNGALGAIAVAHVGERVVVVGHGLAFAAGLALLLDRDPLRAERYTLDNGGMAELAMSLSLNLVRIDPVIACDMVETR